MDYGKRITIESYQRGKLLSSKEVLLPKIEIRDRAHLMEELMETLNLIRDTGMSIGITLITDQTTHEVKRMVREYPIKENGHYA